ncbi:DNA polymerase I [Haloactinospora alba]|uniref:DNA polymerase I n=1 Tax=Haloactinospora alba TaxID=405555 RepID=A0A543NI05_9ACTN|nr:DNA polymerase I [Haloactinospora alba]TQN31477.1 DNA polymerase I [Haloactinospora alba]
MVTRDETPEHSAPPVAEGTGTEPHRRLLLLDGHSLAFRAFYALPKEGFTTTTGQPTNAIYGFTNMLVKLLREEEPTHIAVAWDRSEPTFRHEQYDDYKGGREETPPEFPSQVTFLQELLGLLGIASLSVAGYEADDIIATLATRANEQDCEVVISSGDRDAFQLVSPNCTLLYPGSKISEMRRMTPGEIEDKYGVTPQRYRDYAALVGEKSDNLPGVPGVGPKTAANWLRKYGSLTELISHADEIGGKAGQNLRVHLGDVQRNYQINELLRDVDTGTDIAGLEFGSRGWDRSGVNELFDNLDFNVGLRNRLFDVLGEQPTTTEDADDAPTMDLAVLSTGQVREWLQRHTGTGERAGVVVTRSDGVCRMAVAFPSGAAGHIVASELDASDDGALASWLADPQQPKALHDAKGQLHAVRQQGWEIAGITHDTALAAYLVQPGQRGFDLSDLCMRYLGRELRENENTDAQLTLDIDTDAESAQQHDLATRAQAVADLAATLDGLMAQRGVDRLLHELELPVQRVLADMEHAGIAADREYLSELQETFAAAVRQAVDEAHRAVGREFNLGSPKQLQQVLFDEMGLPKTKKIKTGYTTDADALRWLAGQTENELPVILLRHRDQTKLRTTVEGLIKTVAEDGRIHTTFNQTVAATGRLSSADPNLQNIPVRTDAGRRIRRSFVVGSGYEYLVTADYSQIELRIMAHLSEDPALIEAFTSGHDFHTEIAARVFNTGPEEVDNEARSRIKAMNYGLAYGLSEFGLSQQLGISPGEARELMNGYFAQFGRVREYLNEVVNQARRDGYTATMLGRRRYLPDLTSDNRQRREMAERMALNAPIQGSAADIIKVAMLDVDAALRNQGFASRMLLQVHDELVLEAAPGELEALREMVSHRMAEAYELRVPLDVSVGVGTNWRDAAH